MSGARGEGGHVLLVRLSALGDVVLATAAVEALHAQRPDLEVHFATRDTYADLLRPHPGLARVWPVPGGSDGAAAVRDALRAERFAAVIDLQTNTRSGRLVGGLPGVTHWRAARWPRRRWVWLRITHPAPVRPEWLRFVDALAPLGVIADGAAPPRLGLDPAAVTRAADAFAPWPGARRGAVVFLAPGAHWASKRWPEASFVELARSLVAGGAGVLVGGDASDRAALPALSHWVEGEPAAAWPQADLPGLAALIARCTAAVANDTGLGHLAAAVGVPVVTVFGSTHPGLGFPVAGEGHVSLVRGLACQPCTLHGRPRCPLGHHRCVREIDVAQVRGAVDERLAGARIGARAPAEG